MSGREVAVAAGLVIVAIGAFSETANQHSPAVRPPPAKPVPVPAHTVVIHQVAEHVVTRVVQGSPLAGWQLMLVIIAAIVVSAGVVIALGSRWSLWPSRWMT
jgi:hypothetical protein